MNTDINISGMDKAEVLAALYNASKQQGMGFMNPRGSQRMTTEEARELLVAGHSDFDYLRGRVMKVNLSGSSFNPYLYDRDNGKGAAARALEGISKPVNT